MGAVGQVGAGLVDVGPGRWDEGLRAIGLAGLDQHAHAHRLGVGLLGLNVLVVLGARLHWFAYYCAVAGLLTLVFVR